MVNDAVAVRGGEDFANDGFSGNKGDAWGGVVGKIGDFCG